MTGLPASVRAYKRTPEFTHDTIPVGLRNEHSTKPGVWGVIHIISGTLEFRDEKSCKTQILEAGERKVIAPAAPHQVNPVDSVTFFVEFYR